MVKKPLSLRQRFQHFRNKSIGYGTPPGAGKTASDVSLAGNTTPIRRERKYCSAVDSFATQ